MYESLKRLSGCGNSLKWAMNCECKELIHVYGAKWLKGLKVKKAIDVGSGKSEDLCHLVKNCEEYHFLDNTFLPGEKPSYVLHRQAAGAKYNIESESLDLAITNGSFDHFNDEERMNSFLEIERVLRPGGLLLFGCEYFDYEESDFFRKTQKDDNLIKINCCSFSNINLERIVKRLNKLNIIQRDKKLLPRGLPLRETPHPVGTRLFCSTTSEGLQSSWAAFLVVFKKAR